MATLAAMEQGIPVIAAKENKNRMKNDLTQLGFGAGKLYFAANYPEAVGIMTALKGGVALGSVMRHPGETKVMCQRLGVEEQRDEKVEVLEG